MYEKQSFVKRTFLICYFLLFIDLENVTFIQFLSVNKESFKVPHFLFCNDQLHHLLFGFLFLALQFLSGISFPVI